MRSYMSTHFSEMDHPWDESYSVELSWKLLAYSIVEDRSLPSIAHKQRAGEYLINVGESSIN